MPALEIPTVWNAGARRAGFPFSGGVMRCLPECSAERRVEIGMERNPVSENRDDGWTTRRTRQLKTIRE